MVTIITPSFPPHFHTFSSSHRVDTDITQMGGKNPRQRSKARLEREARLRREETPFQTSRESSHPKNPSFPSSETYGRQPPPLPLDWASGDGRSYVSVPRSPVTSRMTSGPPPLPPLPLSGESWGSSSLPPRNQSGLRVDFHKNFADDIDRSLSAIIHSKRTQANQAITGSRGTIVNALENNFALFVTSMAMKFAEEGKGYISDPVFTTRILDVIRNARSIVDLDHFLPVSVACTQNRQFESIFEEAGDPHRLTHQLLDTIARNIRLFLPMRSTTFKRDSSSISYSSTTPTYGEITVPNTAKAILTPSKPSLINIDGPEGKKKIESPEHKEARTPVVQQRRIVSSYLNKEISGGSVDDVIVKLKKSCPDTRVCEDITGSSVRQGFKFSKDGDDSTIVLTLDVFPDLPIPRRNKAGVQFQRNEEKRSRHGFSLICIDPKLGRYAVINSTVENVKRKFGTPIQRIGMDFTKMTNAAAPNFHHVNTDYANSAAEVLCFAEWFCKNETFNRSEFNKRVQIVKNQMLQVKKPRKKRKTPGHTGSATEQISKPEGSETQDILGCLEVVHDSSDEFSAGQTE